MAKFKQLKEIKTALDGNDVEKAKTLLATLKKEMVGADNARYQYRCTGCELNCAFESGMDTFDTKFCFDEMKSGNGKFVQKDVSIAA